jgi:hypothetical protein
VSKLLKSFAQFSQWIREVQSALDDTSEEGRLQLETTGRLMDFDHSLDEFPHSRVSSNLYLWKLGMGSSE